ncbi:peroxiredoxin [Gephyromycinifex aptenodytis]|uniref:peroxiredoxin n=1 Tax=Gephyromycinifex aptenodytis TaxID=2716227 RepID=UPI0014463B8A|nr:peroxiredoxin [Gephyromycinifex aptenodytis]
MSAPSVGDVAPPFALTNQFGKVVTLDELRAERAALVVFYPFAFSGICTGELQEIRDDLARFQNEHVNTVAISADPMFALRAWDDQEAFFFPLLSDFWPHGQVARSYGVFNEQGGFATRGTFLVDPDGVVQWSLVKEPGERRDFAGFHARLSELIGD